MPRRTRQPPAINGVVALGASAGGVETLCEVVGQLPVEFPMPLFVVMHIASYERNRLPEILNRAGPLRAHHAKDGAKIRPGEIYVAAPDHHLLLDDGRMAVKRGPKENRFRPSIDALFRSAAYVYGSRAIGVVLSGRLDDGTSGLWTIKRLGGVTIVQRPDDARFDSMPTRALEEVEVDHCLPAAEISALLVQLAARNEPKEAKVDSTLRKRVETELAIAVEGGAFQKGIMQMGELTPFTCPECHGALVKLKENKMTRYRCHTGHGYSDSALLEGVMESTGEMLWQVMRSLEEAVMLVEHMGRHIQEEGDTARADAFFKKARELERRSKSLHESVQKHESLSADNVGVERRRAT